MNILGKVNFEDLNKKFNYEWKHYRYVVVDNFFNKKLAEELYNYIPPVEDNRWYKFRNKIFDKDKTGMFLFSATEKRTPAEINTLIRVLEVL